MAVRFIASATAGGNVEPLSITWPAGLAKGYTALLVWTTVNTAVPTTPSGFVSPFVTSNGGGGSQLSFVYRKLLLGSESGALSLASGVAANRQSACLIVLDGLDPSNPINSFAVDITGVAGTTHDAPPLVPTSPDCVFITIVCERASPAVNDTAWSIGAPWTELADTLALATGSGGTITAVAGDGFAPERDLSSVTPPLWTGDNVTGTANVTTYTFALNPERAPFPPIVIPPTLLLQLAEAAQRPYYADTKVSTTTTDAPAESATAQGDAFDAQIQLLSNAESPDATGTANDAAANVQPNAESATATGTAFDATIRIDTNAESATATGTADNPAPALAVNAETATATGAATDATIRIDASAGTATATGAADSPAASLTVNAETATGTGAAFDPTVSTATITNAPAESATASGDAFDAQVRLDVPAGAAAGTGTAQDPQIALSIAAQDASGAGTAQDATVSLQINAESASATGTAFDATVLTGTLAPAGHATADGIANDARVDLLVNAGTATATGAAFDATVTVGNAAPAGTGVATGVANDPRIDLLIGAEQAAAVGTAYDATVLITLPGPGAAVEDSASSSTGLDGAARATATGSAASSTMTDSSARGSSSDTATRAGIRE